MSRARKLRIYLAPDELQRARDGKFNVVTRIKSAFEQHGYRVELIRSTDQELLKSAQRNGYALFHMQDPYHQNALNLRRAYYYPYWRIENTAQRWEFDVARKKYFPDEIVTDSAQTWAANWRRWLFKGAAANPIRDKVIFVPLQGRLLDQRSFQSTSPLEMVKTVIDRADGHRVLVGLHPRAEHDVAELKAVNAVVDAAQNAELIRDKTNEALRICDFVVTQNSSSALSGFFFGKPAILFAQTDFHHIAINVNEIGIDAAFQQVGSHAPDYDKYLYWFVHLNAIKADTEDTEQHIIDRVTTLGWQLD